MFEFHGWSVIRVPEDDAEETARTYEREQAAIEQVEAAVAEADDGFSFFEVRRTGNGMIVLLAHGLRNHRYEPAIGLFRRVAAALPDSYGLLYVHDDERDGHRNEFRVWRTALGRFTEEADPFLSPYIPTVERPLGDAG